MEGNRGYEVIIYFRNDVLVVVWIEVGKFIRQLLRGVGFKKGRNLGNIEGDWLQQY